MGSCLLTYVTETFLLIYFPFLYKFMWLLKSSHYILRIIRRDGLRSDRSEPVHKSLLRQAFWFHQDAVGAAPVDNLFSKSKSFLLQICHPNSREWNVYLYNLEKIFLFFLFVFVFLSERYHNVLKNLKSLP